MRLYTFFLFIALITFACGNDNDLEGIPMWLEAKIVQLEKDGLPGSFIDEYKWKGGLYYHIINPVSSCMFCEFYNRNGKKYEWASDDWDDFHKNAVLLRTVWEEGY